MHIQLHIYILIYVCVYTGSTVGHKSLEASYLLFRIFQVNSSSTIDPTPRRQIGTWQLTSTPLPFVHWAAPGGSPRPQNHGEIPWNTQTTAIWEAHSGFFSHFWTQNGDHRCWAPPQAVRKLQAVEFPVAIFEKVQHPSASMVGSIHHIWIHLENSWGGSLSTFFQSISWKRLP